MHSLVLPSRVSHLSPSPAVWKKLLCNTVAVYLLVLWYAGIFLNAWHGADTIRSNDMVCQKCGVSL